MVDSGRCKRVLMMMTLNLYSQRSREMFHSSMKLAILFLTKPFEVSRASQLFLDFLEILESGSIIKLLLSSFSSRILILNCSVNPVRDTRYQSFSNFSIRTSQFFEREPTRINYTNNFLYKVRNSLISFCHRAKKKKKKENKLDTNETNEGNKEHG